MIKPWIFEFFRAPNEEGVVIPKARTDLSAQDVNDHFGVYWRRWTGIENLGYEGIFFSEHHFGPGYSPSPNLLIAALAPVTRTLRFGVMGLVLPYHQPWRVIEEVGMLDHLTQGRLEVGTASGVPREMMLVGLDAGEAAERNAEAQDILDWALTHPGEPFTHHGKYWRLDNLQLVPTPLQRPGPNRWTTVVSDQSARRSAQRGTRICTGFSSVGRVQTIFDLYREAADQAGHKVDDDWLGLRRVVSISREGDHARELSRRMADQVRNAYLKVAAAPEPGPVPDAPNKFQGGVELSLDEYIAGAPEEVAEQIIEQCRTVGAGHFLAMLDGHGGVEEDDCAIDLFGREVIPLLRKAI